MQQSDTFRSLLHDHFDVTAYNSLPDVGQANAALQRTGRLDDILSLVARLLSDEERESSLGLCLLHKHNEVPAGHLMVEALEVKDGRRSLATRLVEEAVRAEDSVPTTWSLAGNRLAPLEYSADRLAVSGYDEACTTSSTLVRQVGDVIRLAGCEGLLGICVPDRSLFKEITSSQIAVEVSEWDEPANVVTLEERSAFELDKLIQTKWAFRKGIVNAQCVPLCSQYCYWLSPGHAIGHYPNHGLVA